MNATVNVADMTEAEVLALINKGASPTDNVCMPFEIAVQILESDRFSCHLRDWASNTVELALDEE